MDYVEWINYGMKEGWISHIHCYTHDGPDMTEEEVDAWDRGEDPCIAMVRIWE